MGAVTKAQKKANVGAGIGVPDGWDFTLLGSGNSYVTAATACAPFTTNVVWQTTSSNATYCSAANALSMT